MAWGRMRKEQAFWDLAPAAFESWIKDNYQVSYRVIRDLISTHLPANGWVLEIACGPGSFTDSTARSAERLLSMDVSREMVKYAHEKLLEENAGNTSFSVQDGYSLPVRDSSVDAVTLFNILLNVKFPHKVMKEVRRVLKPSGLLLTSCPCWEGVPLHNRLRYYHDLHRRLPSGWRTWRAEMALLSVHHQFSRSTFMELITSAGFEILERTELGSGALAIVFLVARKKVDH